MCEPAAVRKMPPLADRKRILREQGNLCLYCDRMFGSRITLRGRVVSLRLTWDHQVPWAYSRNNSAENFVAACHICNATKNKLMFGSLDEIREHCERYWARNAQVS